ncbi:hypothetical protein PoB_005893700 [Plakobranchus ocellatus]|uniref:Uncharacterized protein n=1 Tax=Plakobranchus ocellatus TaxID=259542 RepID=A0AAV4CLM7_9GAST|nr:hypothetical protein PoB_005893700 [Plakobranchus ocellatus]
MEKREKTPEKKGRTVSHTLTMSSEESMPSELLNLQSHARLTGPAVIRSNRPTHLKPFQKTLSFECCPLFPANGRADRWRHFEFSSTASFVLSQNSRGKERRRYR